MRKGTSAWVLRLSSLLIFFIKSAFANEITQAPPHPSLQAECADNVECHLSSISKRDLDYILPVMFQDMTDEPWLDIEADMVRFDPGEALYQNEVRCWPSVGGVIVASRSVHPVELTYIGVDRLHVNARSWNETVEDAFCMQLCKIGGKWWNSYDDFVRGGKSRMLWPDEMEVLFLGWPEHGGVWVLRFDNWKVVGRHLGPIWNALNIEKRCIALEMLGAEFSEKAEESKLIAPLLNSFGERKRGAPEIEDDGWYSY
ncbi:fungal specific transcription factor protein [Rutstroemia sp. NJR-2017a BVV2]|nr:fungal specific transcription factor protein [Rutstroemia sp. NJR-2017a BVV2]